MIISKLQNSPPSMGLSSNRSNQNAYLILARHMSHNVVKKLSIKGCKSRIN